MLNRIQNNQNLEEKKIHFKDDGLMYLLLNIISHDVIHDYGPAGCSSERWERNQQLLKNFYAESSLMQKGGMMNSDGEDDGEDNRVIGRKRQREIDTDTEDREQKQYKQDIMDIVDDYNQPEIIRGFSQGSQSQGSLSPSSQGLSQSQGSLSPSYYSQGSLSPSYYSQDLSQSQQATSEVSQNNGYAAGIQEKITYSEYFNAIKEMKDMINTTVIFTFFARFIDFINATLIDIPDSINDLPTASKGIDYELSYYYIVPSSEDAIPIEIFETLCYKFIGYCSQMSDTSINDNMNYEVYLNILCEFLSTSYAVEQTIFENLNTIQNKDMEVDDTTGGAKQEQITKEECEQAKKLVGEIDKALADNEQTLIELDGLLKSIIETEMTQQNDINIDNYNIKRYQFLSIFKQILIDNSEQLKADSIDMDFFTIPILPPPRKLSTRNINLVNSFTTKINKSLIADIRGKKYICEKEEKREEEMATKQKEREERIARETEEKAEKQRKADEKAALTGSLTSQDRDVRENLSSFIAKAGLFLTGICNQNGDIIIRQNLQVEPFLKMQIDILLYIAGKNGNWRRNQGFTDIKTQELDDNLIDFFRENIKNNMNQTELDNTTITNPRDNYLYIVNNAAKIPSHLKNAIFCPYSSILDGMVNCSWNSSLGYREYGPMNFKITDENEIYYYNGIMNLSPNPNNDLTLRINVRLPMGTLIGEKTVQITGNDLEAHFVLKNTLVNIIKYVNDNRALMTGNIFENLFNQFAVSQVTNSDGISPFNTVFSEILFKGTGDLFQEINCVCKFGGYTMRNYTADQNILSYSQSSGNQKRFFAANDRPSGTRFIFMLKNGRGVDINTLAFGGYYYGEGADTNLLIKYPGAQRTKTGGRKTIKKYNKRCKKTHRNNKIKCRTIKHKTIKRNYKLRGKSSLRK